MICPGVLQFWEGKRPLSSLQDVYLRLCAVIANPQAVASLMCGDTFAKPFQPSQVSTKLVGVGCVLLSETLSYRNQL